MTTQPPTVEPGQTWLDTAARIGGRKSSDGIRRVVQVRRILTGGAVECHGVWQTRSITGRWSALTGTRISRVQLAHWHRRMRLIRNADGSEVKA